MGASTARSEAEIGGNPQTLVACDFRMVEESCELLGPCPPKERSDATMVNVMTQKVQTVCSKNALLRINDDTMFLETFKDELQVLQEFLKHGTSNQNVIYISICKV